MDEVVKKETRRHHFHLRCVRCKKPLMEEKIDEETWWLITKCECGGQLWEHDDDK